MSAGSDKDNTSNAADGVDRGCSEAKRAAFKRGQDVLVSYGRVQIMQAVGSFAIRGRVTNRRLWRRGWYEIDLGWNVETNTHTLVTAHVSALSAN